MSTPADKDHNLRKFASVGNDEAVRSLILSKANVNASGPSGKTALHRAAMANKLTVVNTLLEAGASPLEVDQDKKTPLSYAEQAGFTDIADALKKKMAFTPDESKNFDELRRCSSEKLNLHIVMDNVEIINRRIAGLQDKMQVLQANEVTRQQAIMTLLNGSNSFAVREYYIAVNDVILNQIRELLRLLGTQLFSPGTILWNIQGITADAIINQRRLEKAKLEFLKQGKKEAINFRAIKKHVSVSYRKINTFLDTIIRECVAILGKPFDFVALLKKYFPVSDAANGEMTDLLLTLSTSEDNWGDSLAEDRLRRLQDPDADINGTLLEKMLNLMEEPDTLTCISMMTQQMHVVYWKENKNIEVVKKNQKKIVSALERYFQDCLQEFEEMLLSSKALKIWMQRSKKSDQDYQGMISNALDDANNFFDGLINILWYNIAIQKPGVLDEAAVKAVFSILNYFFIGEKFIDLEKVRLQKMDDFLERETKLICQRLLDEFIKTYALKAPDKSFEDARAKERRIQKEIEAKKRTERSATKQAEQLHAFQLEQKRDMEKKEQQEKQLRVVAMLSNLDSKKDKADIDLLSSILANDKTPVDYSKFLGLVCKLKVNGSENLSPDSKGKFTIPQFTLAESGYASFTVHKKHGEDGAEFLHPEGVKNFRMLLETLGINSKNFSELLRLYGKKEPEKFVVQGRQKKNSAGRPS